MKNAPVVFYGAGNYACLIFNKLNEKYSPVAFCDSSKLKQGTVVMGLFVYSLDEILNKYPDCLFFITVNEIFKSDVMSILIQNGIQHERIINYEKTRKYISCSFLETRVIHSDNIFNFCCADVMGKKKAPSGKIGKNNEETLLNIINTRDKLIDDLNNPAASLSSHPCVGCHELREGYWNENRNISMFCLGYNSICNMKCIYCNAENSINDKSKIEMKESAERAISFFKYLEDSGAIMKNTFIELASGEISVHPYREEILEAIEDYPVWFYTNASVYNEKIAKILENENSKIMSSVDAGTRKTFYKIKGVDIFDKVCDNLKRYSNHGFMVLKYIFLPGINDNEVDVNGFFNLCKQIKIKSVELTKNAYDEGAYSEHTVNYITKLIEMLQNADISVTVPDWMFHNSNDTWETYKKITKTNIGRTNL
jgi:wyosine [tRNA(Phe)-imidazoG37] synthetase (radical SAM superfamily)